MDGVGRTLARETLSRDLFSVSLTMNIPPQPADGLLAERVKAGIDEILGRQQIEALSIYQDGSSNRSAIQAAQAWLRPALGDLDSQNLIVCAGAQAAIFGILSTTLRRGDTVLCEPLTYPGFLLASRQLGLQVVTVDCDEDGVLPDALEQAQREVALPKSHAEQPHCTDDARKPAPRNRHHATSIAVDADRGRSIQVFTQ